MIRQAWKLVPVEPCVEMVAAWCRQKNTGSLEIGKSSPARDDYSAYRAMISATPPIPDELVEAMARAMEQYWTDVNARNGAFYFHAEAPNMVRAALNAIQAQGVG